MKKFAVPFITAIMIAIMLFSGGCAQSVNIYSNSDNWAYLETDVEGKTADTFFICPSVFSGSDTEFNMPLTDEEAKSDFVGAINMEKGIYDDDTRFFAPYYRQIGLNVYEMSNEEQEKYLQFAYQDVKNSFEYYLANYNNGRPIVVAGFSQGADLAIRLLKDCFKANSRRNLLVACYAIGWRITEQELLDNPHLKFASGESDTGVIISFNSEADYVNDSMIIPSGTKTLAINPLNWKTDGTIADAALNMGACFTRYNGAIRNEIPNLCGCYIDSVRGALKIVGVTSTEYPPRLDIFEDGVYHLYDYQFFYRNLEANVQTRINAFIA